MTVPLHIRVLHIDAAACLCRLVAGIFSAQDVLHRWFDVDGAADLDEAAVLLRAGAYDVVVLDLALKETFDEDTYDALRLLTDLPIVIYTGNDDIELALRLIEKGAESYLLKDQVDSEILARVILYTLARGRRGNR